MPLRLALIDEPAEPDDSSGVAIRVPLGAADVDDEVLRLALGMLWHPAEAEQAKREIQSATLPGAPAELDPRAETLRAAVRHLLEREPSLFEQQGWSFEVLAGDLERGLDETLPKEAFGPHSGALVEEVKLGCWQTMLLCLDRPHRIAYLVAQLEGLDPSTAAAILELDVEEFRARANRAELLLRGFMADHCGLVNRARPCRCTRRLGRALLTGRVDPNELLFARTEPAR